jgi:transcriptional regulator with XRE-family HTH domain
MNIEIANRLAKLRKEKGYSQEELAEKLGLSRQAVSKWERAESSPDTDNLICLAKLYNISLDELLRIEEDKKEIKEKKDVKITPTSIQVKDGDEEVNISFNGIYIKDGDEAVVIGNKPIEALNEADRKKRKIKEKLTSVYILLVVVGYILLGALLDLWHPAWILFITIPLFDSFIEAINRKNPKTFAFSILATVIFLFVGCVYDIWHPTWVVFILIPVYYALVPGDVDVKVKLNPKDEDEEDN